LKIGVISTIGESWGGSEELWADMALTALSKGYEIIISVNAYDDKISKLEMLRLKGAVILERLQKNQYAFFNNTYLRTLRSQYINIVRKKIPDYKSVFKSFFFSEPDIICISQGQSYDAVYCPELLNSLELSRIPYLIICHSNGNEYSPTDNYIIEKAIKFYSDAERVLFVSHNNKKLAEKQLASRIENAQIIKNPVNLEISNVLSWPDYETCKMACISSLDIKRKAIDILLEALSNNKWMNRRWILNIYGEGQDKNYILKLIDFFNLKEKVNIMGYESDVAKIWSENHILVLPSRIEGTPLALVEAMLCGRPSVVTDIGGNSEWVSDEVTGFIAEGVTAFSFDKAMERAWLKKDQWEQIGYKAHKYSFTNIDKDPGVSLLNLIVDDFESCYLK